MAKIIKTVVDVREIECSGCLDCELRSQEHMHVVDYTSNFCNHPKTKEGWDCVIDNITPHHRPDWCPLLIDSPPKYIYKKCENGRECIMIDLGNDVFEPVPIEDAVKRLNELEN